MGLEYRIIYGANMDEGEYLLFWRKIREINERMYSYIRNSLLSDGTVGLRDDVLKFISENVSSFPKENKSIHDLFTLICDTNIDVKCWDFILTWMKTNSVDDISDFAIVFCAAINKDIPLDIIKEYFTDNKGMMSIFKKIGEYEVVEEEKVEEFEMREIFSVDSTENIGQEDNSTKPSLVDRVKIEIEPRRNTENNYNEMLDHMVNIMSLRNLDVESIHEAHDHVNRIISQAQLSFTELSVYITEIIREWEKDKNKLVQLNSILEIQKKLFSEQQIKMSALMNANAELENRLRELEASLQKRDAIHQKARELAEMTDSSSSGERRNYPYLR